MSGCGGNHSVCEIRLEKEGSKVRCCWCVPHEGCEFNKQKTKKEKVKL